MYEGNPHSLQILSIFLFLPAISETRYDFLTIQNTLNCFKLTSKPLQSHFKVFEADHIVSSVAPALSLSRPQKIF